VVGGALPRAAPPPPAARPHLPFPLGQRALRMGIPKYRRWLHDRFPDAFTSAQSVSADHVVRTVSAQSCVARHKCYDFARDTLRALAAQALPPPVALHVATSICLLLLPAWRCWLRWPPLPA
jgi:hypothetical protein